jgi:hypothetical protein
VTRAEPSDPCTSMRRECNMGVSTMKHLHGRRNVDRLGVGLLVLVSVSKKK